MSNATLLNPGAFDAVAEDYDRDFTHSAVGRMLRPRAWSAYRRHFAPGQKLLELSCGTGEDAVWLAQQGMTITATDASAEMVRLTRAKAERAGVAVTAYQLSLQEFAGGGRPSVASGQFDGVYSNFGGLNVVAEWRSLAQALAEMVRPGGRVVLVPMGPFCPWEIIWHVGHGQVREAARRFRGAARAKIGDTTISVWYPSAGRLKQDFAPWFRHVATESLGLWLPPSYLEHLVQRWPGLFNALGRLEKRTGSLTGGWGDHYIIVFERANGDC